MEVPSPAARMREPQTARYSSQSSQHGTPGLTPWRLQGLPITNAKAPRKAAIRPSALPWGCWTSLIGRPPSGRRAQGFLTRAYYAH